MTGVVLNFRVSLTFASQAVHTCTTLPPTLCILQKPACQRDLCSVLCLFCLSEHADHATVNTR